MTRPTPTPLQREDAAAGASDDAQHHRRILEAAKARAKARGDRPGEMTGTPRFDQVHEASKNMRPAPGHDVPPPTLSPETSRALEEVARANRPVPQEPQVEEAAPERAEAMELDVEGLADLFGIDLRLATRVHEELHPVESQDALIRRRIEQRLQPIDIGEFLMNGVFSQKVVIVPMSETVKTGLAITYQTVSDAVESVVDRLLSEEAARIRKVRDGEKFIDVEMSQREYVRRQNEYALAVHITSYNGDHWRTLIQPDGTVNEDALQARLAKVRLIPSPVLTYALQNLGWFLERVQSALEVSVLGNG
jgi:hypothetical protein